MTHDQILIATRDRIAAIDARIATLTAERAKFAAMVDVSDGKVGYDFVTEALKRLGESAPPPPWVPNVRPCQPPPWQPGIVTPWGFPPLVTIAYTAGDTLVFRPTTSGLPATTVSGSVLAGSMLAYG